jgi:hypothetical protein
LKKVAAMRSAYPASPKGFVVQEFDPTDFQTPEIRRQCKEFLGYHSDTDGDLEPILDEAMNSPLPDGWRLYVNRKSGQKLFFHSDQNKQSELRPFLASFRQKFQVEKARLRNSVGSSDPPDSNDATAESLDHHFEPEDVHNRNRTQLDELRKRHRTEINREKQFLAEVQRRRRQYQSELRQLQNERHGIRKLRQQNVQDLAELKADHEQVLSQMKRDHEQQIRKLALMQEAEMHHLMGDITAVRSQRLKQFVSDRQKYRAAIERLLDPSEPQRPVTLENEIDRIRGKYEHQLFELKNAYELAVLEQRLALQHAESEGKEELKRLRASLDQRKALEIARYEKDILKERQRNAGLKLRKKQPKELVVSPVIAIGTCDDDNDEALSPIISHTEVPPFESIQPHEMADSLSDPPRSAYDNVERIQQRWHQRMNWTVSPGVPVAPPLTPQPRRTRSVCRDDYDDDSSASYISERVTEFKRALESARRTRAHVRGRFQKRRPCLWE